MENGIRCWMNIFQPNSLSSLKNPKETVNSNERYKSRISEATRRNRLRFRVFNIAFILTQACANFKNQIKW